jgi:acetyl esterase/lipase
MSEARRVQAKGELRGAKMAEEHEVAIKPDIVFAEHDGVKLLGDLYLPKCLHEVPVLVAAHGGGWQLGDRKFYRHWGNYLAKNGYAVFAVEYRLMKPGVKTWPGAVCDTKAAVQFVRAEATNLGLDPERIGLIGDSAGAHLSALVALASEEPLFAVHYRDDRYASTPTNVKAVVGFYGVYDMVAQWEHDQITRPRDPIVEKLLGGPPMVSRKIYFEASPLSYATVDKSSTRFLLIYGREDDIVDPATQSEKFLTALKQAGFFARTIVVPGAGHFWSVDPVEEHGSFGAYVGPKLLRFLDGALPPLD